MLQAWLIHTCILLHHSAEDPAGYTHATSQQHHGAPHMHSKLLASYIASI